MKFSFVFMFTCVLVLVVFIHCISHVTNLASWLQDFNKLTYSYVTTPETEIKSFRPPKSSEIILKLFQQC